MKAQTASGKIIYLNGTSSSGKTTLSEALLNELQEPYLQLSINFFDQLLSCKQIQRGLVPDQACIELGFTKCIEALASSGHNIIVDDVIAPPQDLPSGQKFYSRDLLRQRVTTLSPFDVLFVKVFCPLDELERREIAREDRIIGLARFQFDLVHQHAIYDVEVDTFTETPATSVVRVLDALRNPQKPSAFALMHDELIQSG